MSKKQFAAEVHHRVVKKFPRRQVIVSGIDNIWGMDLADMYSFIKYNDDYRYILCIIDVFSKFAWCVPLKTKSATSILTAVKDVIKSSDRSPEKFWIDQGTEFYNKDFKKWLADHGMSMYSTYGESKSAVVERFIRTLKDLMTKEFTEYNTRNWVELLPKVLNVYNNRVHRTIKMSPMEASDPDNEALVHRNMYPVKREKKVKKPQFKVGDDVRISRVKGIFEKGMENNFSYEVFKIAEVLNTDPVTYKIKDESGEVLEGSFYTQELLKTQVPDYFEIDAVLQTRKIGKKKQSFVKFVGIPKKFNAWIDDDQMYDI